MVELSIEEKINQYKKKIKVAEEETAKLTGVNEEVFKQLKIAFSITDLTEADNLLEKIKKGKEIYSNKMEILLKELEESWPL